MSAFCACFRSSNQVTDNNNGGKGRGRGNRPEVRKGNKEMDLLEMQKNGIPDITREQHDPSQQLDTNEPNSNFITSSHQTDNHDNQKVSLKTFPIILSIPITLQPYEESYERVIDEFMKSPRNNNQARRSLAQAKPQGIVAGTSLANTSSFKKTGVCVSKCYQMLCGRCGRRFTSKL